MVEYVNSITFTCALGKQAITRGDMLASYLRSILSIEKSYGFTPNMPKNTVNLSIKWQIVLKGFVKPLKILVKEADKNCIFGRSYHR
jgi:hypothetical protein